jgi:antitoxin component HigA of HigAB toxin-antitoxin module
MAEITKNQALNRLRAKISYDKKIKDLAKDFGVSSPFMSAVLSGKKSMTEQMLNAVGVRRVVTYFAED